MKTTFKLKFLTISIIFLGFAAVANAQNTATATASATVVEGSSVRKDKDLNFGSLIKGNTQGSVHIAPNGQMTYSGITAPSGSSNTPQAAQFTVLGTAGASFSISTPSSFTLTNTNGTGTMTVSGIDITNWNNTIGSGGETTFNVGGWLTVPANPNVGLYQNTSDFVITIQFN